MDERIVLVALIALMSFLGSYATAKNRQMLKGIDQPKGYFNVSDTKSLRRIQYFYFVFWILMVYYFYR